jgi:hypothetical protein
MDELMTLDRQQVLNTSLKISKCKSLIKRRFQSLGLKYVTDQRTRERITKIEKSVSRQMTTFCSGRDIESLTNITNLLTDLFLLKGVLKTRDKFGDIESSYWSVASGPIQEWVDDILDSDRPDCYVESLTLTFDDCEQRKKLIAENSMVLGGYLLPYFIDFTKMSSFFIDAPDKIHFSNIQRLKSPVHPKTTNEHIIAIEDSPLLSRLKYRLLETIDKLPDQAGLYTSTFNHIIDTAVFTHININENGINSYGVCQNVISAFADTLLTLPVFNTGINEQYRHWTPWCFNFVEFSRQASKLGASIYVPEPGQLKWKSPEHKLLAEACLISSIIPIEYHWQLGIPTMWRNQYRDHHQRLEMIRDWGLTHGIG